MDTPILLRQARNGDTPLSFRAAVLAAATTARPGASRWTELVVYRLPVDTTEETATGGYVVSKIGRSLVVHKPTCSKANPRKMDTPDPWVDPDPARVACLQCQPYMGILDQRLLMERDRHAVLQARSPVDLAKVLLQGRPGTPLPTAPTGIVAEVLAQVRRSDPDFDLWAAAHLDGSLR